MHLLKGFSITIITNKICMYIITWMGKFMYICGKILVYVNKDREALWYNIPID